MRQNIRPNPSEKLFEAYMDFAGGLNSETSNEKLKDNEYPVMQNVDLSGRGSAKRRTGRVSLASQAGTAQGAFFYYKQFQTEPDMILAISGRLYVKPYNSNTLTEIPITDSGSAFTFQATLPIEAVQYGDDLFIATGTKLVELTWDTTVIPNVWKAQTVIPYTPTVMEAIYIGTNALAANPDAYVQDGTSTSLEVAGIKPAKRTGTVNQALTMTAYINKPASITAVDYKWEYKKSSETAYTMGRDWTAGSAGKSWDFNANTASTYDVRVTARDNAAQTNTAAYVLSSFIVNQVESKTNTDLPVSGIQKCRKIMLHWDRILLAKDDTNPYQLYVSDLNNPRYIPVMNTIKFDTGKQEPITSIVRYQDFLIFFTKTTIQTLTGKGPDDYSRSLIHDGIGCIADRSAQVVGNNVAFLSHEGVHLLKPNMFKLQAMNVQRVDYPIKSDLPKDENACAIVYDSQYWLCFPSSSVLYRLYYDNGMWVKDKSSKLNFNQFLQYGNTIYNLTTTGSLYKHDSTVYNDCGEIFDVLIETKSLDLSASFNYKKLRRLYILSAIDASYYVTVDADGAVILDPETGEAVVGADGYVTWQVTSSPNVIFPGGSVLGQWELGESFLGTRNVSIDRKSIQGKCRRVKIQYKHSEDKFCEIFGFGLEFKLKKP